MPSEQPGPAAPPPPPPAGPAPEAPAEVAQFVTPRRLHPASVVLGIPLMQLVQALIVPAAATFAAGRVFTVGFLLVAGVVGLGARILGWQRRLFSFDGEVLRVDSGVLSRSHRSLDVARIQQVEIHRGPVQRLLNLASLRIETAGSASEPEVDLRVLPEADALALRSAVRASKARLEGKPVAESHAPDAPEGRRILTVPMTHVAIAAVTGARLLVLPAVIGGAFQFIGQQIGGFVDDTVGFFVDRGIGSPEGLLQRTDWGAVALVAAGVVVLTVVAAIAVGIVRDGNFRIDHVDDDLHITRGLISTRESVVPLRRVQLVEVERNWLRRLLGYAVVRIRSAGGSTGGDGRVTVPLLAEGDVDRLLREILPGVPGVPELRSHPPQALRRGLIRWLRPVVLLAAVLWIVPQAIDFFDVPVVRVLQYVVLALIALNVLLAIVEYRHLGHGLTELVVASRRGALSITTTISPVVKVQAVTSRQNLFQRRLELTTLVAHVAGPAAVVEVLDAHERDAADLHERLTDHAASPIPLVPGDDEVANDGPAGDHPQTDGPGPG